MYVLVVLTRICTLKCSIKFRWKILIQFTWLSWQTSCSRKSMDFVTRQTCLCASSGQRRPPRSARSRICFTWDCRVWWELWSLCQVLLALSIIVGRARFLTWDMWEFFVLFCFEQEEKLLPLTGGETPEISCSKKSQVRRGAEPF